MIRRLEADVIFFGYGNFTDKIISDFSNKNKNIICITNNYYPHVLKNNKYLNFMTYQDAINCQINSNSTIFTWQRDPNFIKNKDLFFEWLRSDSFLTKRSFLLSSASVYKDSLIPLTESLENLELQVELNVKYVLEILLTDLMKYKNSSHINLRISNVYGTNLDYGFIGSLMKSISSRLNTELVEDYKVVRDYIYVDDVIHAIQELIGINMKNETFNISTGVGTTTDQIFEIFADSGFNFQKVPRISTDKNLKKVSILNCSALSKLINWTPRSIDSALSFMLGK